MALRLSEIVRGVLAAPFVIFFMVDLLLLVVVVSIISVIFYPELKEDLRLAELQE